MNLLIFGATGSAGGSVLKRCLTSPSVSTVRAITRRRIPNDDPKLHQFVHDDFTRYDSIAAAFDSVDACYFCLGISALQVPDETRYRVITRDYAVAAASQLRQRSPNARFHYLSGAGARTDSRQMWARIKAEAEQQLRASVGAVCWRPGFIDGEVATTGPWSVGALRPLFRLLRFWKSMYVSGDDLGRAMLQATREQWTNRVVENREIREVAARWTG